MGSPDHPSYRTGIGTSSVEILRTDFTGWLILAPVDDKVRTWKPEDLLVTK